MYFHSQNISDKKDWGWRFWLRPNGESYDNELHGEFHFPTSHKHFHIDLNGCGEDDSIAISFAFIVYIHFSFYNRKLSSFLDKLTKRKDMSYSNGREIGITWYEGMLWINLWNDPMESRSSDPWWHHITFIPADFLLGKEKYSTVDKDPVDVKIKMPEKDYDATAKIFTSTWTRSRFPFIKKSLRRIDVEIPGGIPHPGKGTTSYNCGDDALFGSTFAFPESMTLEDACNKVKESVMYCRNNYPL